MLSQRYAIIYNVANIFNQLDIFYNEFGYRGSVLIIWKNRKLFPDRFACQWGKSFYDSRRYDALAVPATFLLILQQIANLGEEFLFC